MLPLRDARPRPSPGRNTMACVFVAGLCAVFVGCGACPGIEQQYRTWLTDELLNTGTGRSPAPGGHVHLRVLLGNEVLRTIASAASGASPFAPVRMQRRSNTGDDAPTYLFRATPSLQNVLIQTDNGQPALQLALQFDGSVNVERRTDADESRWRSTIQVIAPLTLGAESDGASLRVDLRRATMGPMVSDCSLPHLDDRTTVEAMLISELQRQLNESSDDIALLRVPTIGAGRGRIELRAVELQQMDERGGLSLGFVTSLRPESITLPSTIDVAGPHEFRVEMVSDLPEAYARMLVAGNVVPRVFDATGQPDPDGSWARSLTALAPAGNELTASIERWCFRERPCSRSSAQVQVRVPPADVASPAEPALTMSASEMNGADAGDRAFVQALLPAFSALLAAPTMILASGETLDVRLSNVTLGDERIALEGVIEFEEEPPASD